MQKLKQIYRSNYSGESIVTNLTLEDNEWIPETEHVPNSVFNAHSTTQAVAIANGATRANFDLTFIANHKGGLLAEDKLQSYGCNSLYKTFSPDFLVATDETVIKDISESEYINDNIVYVNAQHIVEYPGKFYLVPQNPAFDAGSMAAYIAAFDGHKKVFLLGYDSYAESGENSAEIFWIKTLLSVVQVYNDVEFVRVMPTAEYSCSDALMSQPNFRQIDYRGFVLEADIG
jgi:hypothetical protein